VRYERSIDIALAKLEKAGVLDALAKRRGREGEAGDAVASPAYKVD
jgi:hypothetical protein